MGRVYDALVSLSTVQDEEVLDGFRRYESSLAAVLTQEQMELYADYLQRTDVVRIFEEMETHEIAALPSGIPAIAARVVADTDLTMENRRVVALLNQHGDHSSTPDFETEYHRGSLR